MKKVFIITISLSTALGLTACRQVQTKPSTSGILQDIEQIENLEAFPSSEGNIATLVKTTTGCMIQFTGFYETGKAEEQWYFNGDDLVLANTTISYYANGGLANSENINGNIEVARQEKKFFDIQNPDVQNNFKALRANFKPTSLTQCSRSE